MTTPTTGELMADALADDVINLPADGVVRPIMSSELALEPVAVQLAAAALDPRVVLIQRWLQAREDQARSAALVAELEPHIRALVPEGETVAGVRHQPGARGSFDAKRAAAELPADVLATISKTTTSIDGKLAQRKLAPDVYDSLRGPASKSSLRVLEQ